MSMIWQSEHKTFVELDPMDRCKLLQNSDITINQLKKKPIDYTIGTHFQVVIKINNNVFFE